MAETENPRQREKSLRARQPPPWTGLGKKDEMPSARRRGQRGPRRAPGLSATKTTPRFGIGLIVLAPPGAKTGVGVGADLQFRIPFQPEATLANSLYLPIDTHNPHLLESYHAADTPLFCSPPPQNRKNPGGRRLRSSQGRLAAFTVRGVAQTPPASPAAPGASACQDSQCQNWPTARCSRPQNPFLALDQNRQVLQIFTAAFLHNLALTVCP